MATTVGVFLVSPTSWDIHLVKQSLWSGTTVPLSLGQVQSILCWYYACVWTSHIGWVGSWQTLSIFTAMEDHGIKEETWQTHSVEVRETAYLKHFYTTTTCNTQNSNANAIDCITQSIFSIPQEVSTLLNIVQITKHALYLWQCTLYLTVTNQMEFRSYEF